MSEHIIIAFILALFGWVCVGALDKGIDWLESIYCRIGTLIAQNEEIQAKLNTIINSNSEGLDFVEIKGNKQGINGADPFSDKDN